MEESETGAQGRGWLMNSAGAAFLLETNGTAWSLWVNQMQNYRYWLDLTSPHKWDAFGQLLEMCHSRGVPIRTPNDLNVCLVSEWGADVARVPGFKLLPLWRTWSLDLPQALISMNIYLGNFPAITTSVLKNILSYDDNIPDFSTHGKSAYM